MNPAALHARLAAATVAIGDLGQRGVHARRVEVSPRITVIVVDQPPPSSWIRGALRRRVNGVREYAAPFQGCQLRWEQADAAA